MSRATRRKPGPSPTETAMELCRRHAGCEGVAGAHGTGYPTDEIRVLQTGRTLTVVQTPTDWPDRPAGLVWLTPGTARELAAALVRLAERAEGGER